MPRLLDNLPVDEQAVKREKLIYKVLLALNIIVPCLEVFAIGNYEVTYQ